MEGKWLLIPMFLQVVLTLSIYFITYRRRVNAVKNEGLDPLYFKTQQQGVPPREMKQADDLLLNLFEAPVLFFAGCVTALAMELVDEAFIVIASVFVLCRYIHAKEVLGRNSIRKRFRPWSIGIFTLWVMWFWLLFRAFT